MAGPLTGPVPARREDLTGGWLSQLAAWSGWRRRNDGPEPDQQAPEMVLDASALLDVTEFDLFRLAYRRRFGRQPNERMLETVFADYMLRGEVPGWVRTLCREVIDGDKRGILDADAMGAGRFRDRPARPPHGTFYVGAVVAVWLVLIACLLDLQPDPVVAAASADCRGGQSLYHDWVAMIAGRAQAGCLPLGSESRRMR